jgi:hypothetical protein
MRGGACVLIGGTLVVLQPKQYRFDPVESNTTKEGFQAVQHSVPNDAKSEWYNKHVKSVLSWQPPCMAK